MEVPPTNPFSGSCGNNDHGEEGKFEAFSLSSPAAHDTGSSPLPSLQSIQQHELHQMQQQQQQQQQQQASSGAVEPQQLTFDSLPSPEELSGPIGSSSGLGANDKSWPPPPPPANTNNNNNSSQGPNYGTANTNTNQSFLSKLLSCGGVCSVEVLRPYFDVDTADILVRMKGSLTYLMVNDGFKTEVLYSDNAMRLAYRDTDTAAGVGGEEGTAEGGTSTSTNNAIATSTPDTASPGKGPDLYGPIWITLTLVFFVAVTSNMHLYIHHTFKKSIVDEGGIAAKEEWDYDINQLLHATWILYSFTLGLPSVLYFVLRLVGVNNVGLAELICYYGYSLVGYLPVTWLCVVPHGWVQWPMLIVATILSGMLVLRNLVGPILESGGGVQGKGKGGGLIMFVVACHFVFLLVMKLVFYHAHS